MVKNLLWALYLLNIVFVCSCKINSTANIYGEISQEPERNIASNPENRNLNINVPCDNGDAFINGVCVNKELPLAPSIRRFLGKAGENEVFPETIQISGATDRYEANRPDHIYKVLPYWRPTLDARLYIASANNWTNHPAGFPNNIPNMGGITPMLAYLDPENFDYDGKINNANPFIASASIHPIVYLTYHSVHTKLDFSTYKNNHFPGTYHMDFCHDKFYEQNSNPRTCQAYLDSTNATTLTGDCYDVTILTYSGLNDKNEIRTVPVTIFIKQAKVSGQNEEIVIYPRKLTGILSSYIEMRNLANIGNPADGNISNIKFLSDQCINPNGSFKTNTPLFCDFVKNQKRIISIKVKGDTKIYPNGPPFFEPSISGDGKLLFVNFGLGKGLHYSYNVNGDCSATGWKDFYPISKMPFDKNVYENYPIGKAQRRIVYTPWGTKKTISVPFKDGVGDDIPEDRNIEGAYLWADRKVRNIFFNAVNVVHDNYIGEKNSECLSLDPNCVLDRSPGKGLHALGVWTRGRTIHLDSVANMFDFGSRPTREPTDQRVFQMKLYKDEVTTLRPSAMTVIGSPENHLNEYDALSPVAPFDVVWKFSSNNERTGELIFDDYLNQFLFFGTHFTQSTKQRAHGDGFITLYKNGYVPQLSNFSTEAGTKSKFQLKEIPLLQNISGNSQMSDGSTADFNLEVLGGARVEPIAMGGVIAKGLFLDGNNDSAAISVNVKKSGSAWLLSLWLDPRTLDQQERVVFGFPDYTSIAITDSEFVAKSCNNNICTSNKLAHSGANIEVGKYFHLTVKIESLANPKTNPSLKSFNHIRRLTFYVNGTQLIENKMHLGYSYKKKFIDFGFNEYLKQGFDLFNNNQPGIFSVGRQNLLSSEKSFHGWIDELKVFKFGAIRNDTYPVVLNYFREVICNNALGSMIEVLQTDKTNTLLNPHYQIANSFGHWATTPKKSLDYPPILHPKSSDFVLQQSSAVTQVCEQLKIESYNSHAEFADQREGEELICADKVHANPHLQFGHRCLRKRIFETENKSLKAGAPRPAFDTVPFCLSCHKSGASIPELSKDALIFININREADHRRQPLDVHRNMNGCIPTDPIFGSEAGTCNSQGLLLDFIFDFNPKITPK